MIQGLQKIDLMIWLVHILLCKKQKDHKQVIKTYKFLFRLNDNQMMNLFSINEFNNVNIVDKDNIEYKAHKSWRLVFIVMKIMITC